MYLYYTGTYILTCFENYFKVTLFHTRSITLVGEKERKVLKEIIKQAKTPVKSRIIPPGEE